MASYQPVIKNGASGAIFYVSLAPRTATGAWQNNPTLAAGDVKVSLDGGTLNNLGTLPVVTPASSKMVKVTLSQAETNADNVTIVFSDAAGAEWSDLTVNLQTVVANFDSLSGRIPTALVSGRMDSSVGAMAAGTVTAAAIATDAIDNDAIAANAVTEIQAGLATAASITTLSGFVDTEVAAILAAVDTEVAAIKLKTDNLPTDPADASDIAARFTTLDTAVADLPTNAELTTALAGLAVETAGEVWNVTAADHQTGGTFGKTVGDISAGTFGFSTHEAVETLITAVSQIPNGDQNAEALLDYADAIETDVTVRGALRLGTAALAGKVSGAGSGTETFRNVGDSKDRIVSSVDVSGNRTAVATDTT